MIVLVVNAGSSSLKYAVLDSTTGRRAVTGDIERIGEFDGGAADHAQAFGQVLEVLADVGVQPEAVGHRVVHGGDRFSAPAVIDDDVVAAIAACVPLAPLHNPAALAGIAAARRAFPDVPQVAVFDTAFHADMPPAAHTYAIDREVARQNRFRRYGFHGTSHRYVSRRAADLLGRTVDTVDVVSLHLGNGASACAVQRGRSIDTSMGATPLEGLVMGTRSGDVDPAIPVILARDGWDAAEIDDLLNRRSGLLGLGGSNDMRRIHALAEDGDAAADLAREVFCRRVTKYLGAYLALLGGADAVVFTAGIGENDPWVRSRVCTGLERLGIVVDPDRNGAPDRGPRRIDDGSAPTAVMVIPTDEELAIATECAETLARA